MTSPSHEDVTSSLDRIRGTLRGPSWDHPLGDFLQAADDALAAYGAIERLAAYRLMGLPAPVGYYDGALDDLYRAIETLLRQRESDHGDAPIGASMGGVPGSQSMRAAVAMAWWIRFGAPKP